MFGLQGRGLASLLAVAAMQYGPLAAADRENCAPASSGNPIVEGWYADPDIKVYDGVYWVYPTFSAPYLEQTFLDAFSSTDLIHWTKHSRILDRSNVSWAWRAIWAPSPVYRNGKYYLYFGANDIQSNSETGGIGVATADSPAGPFVDALGRPLIGQIINGAQPIDQNVFIDDDGKAYIYYGGWGHANVARLNDDMVSLGLLPDGSTFREITPSGYVEGAFMFKRKGIYYLMWSEGGWTGPDYRVSYAMANSPLGPFPKLGTILRQNAAIATGSGHNSVVNVPGTDDWYIFYHRRPLGFSDGNHRVLSYDALSFNDDGTIRAVEMSSQDNFCDGNSLGWGSFGGAWRVEDGAYSVDGSPFALSLLNNNFATLASEAEVAVDGGGNAGIVFRASNATANGPDAYRGYFAGLEPGSDRVFVGKADGYGWTELASASVPIDPNVFYHLRVVAKGSQIEVFLNHAPAPVLRLSDASYASGATGVRAFATAARFDNVRTTVPEAAVFYLDGNYSGQAVSLNPGWYTLGQLNAAGLPNDSVSSLQLPQGWRAEIYQDDNFAGRMWSFSGSAALLPADANDQMSSVKIFAQ